jgi:basic amino acid/polyamine antiporter, APA family
VTVEFNQALTWLSYNMEEGVEFYPVFMLYAGVLIDNLPIFLLVGFGLVLWSYFWIPSAMIIASRAMFAWAFDRVAPEKLSDVDPRTGSPVTSILTICTLALIFLGLYYLDWFTFLAPMLAYSCVFFLVSLCGIAFPYVEKVRPYYLASGAKTVAGIPLFTLCGIGGAIYYGIAIYFLLTEDGLGVNNTKAITLTALEFVVPFVAYFVIRAVRASQGIMLDRAFQEIPPD